MHHNECKRHERLGDYVVIDGYVLVPLACNDCSSKCKSYYREVTVHRVEHDETCRHHNGTTKEPRCQHS